MKLNEFMNILAYELQPWRSDDFQLFLNEAKSSLTTIWKFIIPTTWSLISEVGYLIKSFSLSTWTYFGLTCLTYSIFNYFGFTSLFIILSLYILIFKNLGVRKKGELSAYSVFNSGYRRLLGTLTAEQFEKEIRHDDGFGDAIGGERIEETNDDDAEDLGIRDTSRVPAKSRKSGKKARRTYEKRLMKKRLAERDGMDVQDLGDWELEPEVLD